MDVKNEHQKKKFKMGTTKMNGKMGLKHIRIQAEFGKECFGIYLQNKANYNE